VTEHREHATPRGAGLEGRARVLLVGYAVVVAVVLFSPTAQFQTATVVDLGGALRSFLPDGLATFARVEMLLNVLLVAPVTFLGTLVWPRLRWQDWTAYVFVAAATVEVLQGLLLPGRDASFTDVFANTAGALLGAALAAVLVRRPR
jgi:VanZ family protein